MSCSTPELGENTQKNLPDGTKHITDFLYVIDPEAERRLVRRLDMRIVPACMLTYLLASLDRSNVGNAKVLNKNIGTSLQQTIHITDQQYLVALMIFLVAYAIVDIPSNYLLKRFQPGRWIGFLMFGWGAMTLILGGVKNASGFTGVRFLLGAFESGLFPGVVFVMTTWYKPNERGVRIALILASASLAGAFGGAIAYGVGRMDDIGGLYAWRWLFLLEGIPSCILAVFVFFFFPNYPETATWLSLAERELATNRIAGVALLGHAEITWKDAKATLLDRRLYLHYLLNVSISVPFSTISLFTPAILGGIGYTGLNAQLFSAPPYACAFIVTVSMAWFTDRYDGRSWATFASLVIAGICFIVEGALPADAFKAKHGILCIAVSFSFAGIPQLLGWLTANLRGTGSLTLAVPLNISLTQAAQIAGVYTYKSSESPRYPTGHYTNAALLLAGSFVVLILRHVYTKRNRALGESEITWKL